MATALTSWANRRYLAPVTPHPSIPLHRPGPFGPSVQAWVLPYLIRWVEEQAVDASAIRQLPGMTDLTDPDVRVPEASVNDAWRLAASLTHDAAIGLHVAEWLPRGALDLVEYAFRSSASLADALKRLVRYGRVISDRLALRLDTNHDKLVLQVRDAGSTPLHHGRAEFAMAVVLKLARDSTGRHIVPQQVCFAHPASAEDLEYSRFFQVRAVFDAGSTSMILGAEDASRELIGADDALSAIVHRRLDKVLTDRRESDAGQFQERVRRLMVEHLGRTTLTPLKVAKTLGVSRRTLSRRLAEEGTSFRDIFDDVRRESACALLQDRGLSVGDVAFFLQYSEPAAFHRAFRRWRGQTPRDFRTTIAPS